MPVKCARFGARGTLDALTIDDILDRLARESLPPVPPEEIGPWLWDDAWARSQIGRELEAPSPFAAWRIGEWAGRLVDPAARSATYDLAIDAFEALIPTPIGPGNDAGPFCEIAHALSNEQTERALSIVARMRDAGWGEEADNAHDALLSRRPPLPYRDDRWDEPWDPSGPGVAARVRQLEGQAGVDKLRRALLVLPLGSLIDRRIDVFLASPPEKLAWHVDVVQRERFLPLYIGWEETYGLRVDGQFVRWAHESEGRPVLPLAKDVHVALCQGARRYPELAELIPPRPATADTCGDCRGVGCVRGQPHILCQCGGRGWL